ncbi:hypothetical protein SAMN05216505_102315 [Streptomyces prasinopilosus]|uniref:Uncharacterized protein n=1 Tax=Streptomyces prasinopilosus TaxID=67344 RepID=A0A1G6LYZ1_9ACTN|nr:hypothetical protein SAMN05216505_102315 [Streptomyces prasinopilosus]
MADSRSHRFLQAHVGAVATAVHHARSPVVHPDRHRPDPPSGAPAPAVTVPARGVRSARAPLSSSGSSCACPTQKGRHARDPVPARARFPPATGDLTPSGAASARASAAPPGAARRPRRTGPPRPGPHRPREDADGFPMGFANVNSDAPAAASAGATRGRPSRAPGRRRGAPAPAAAASPSRDFTRCSQHRARVRRPAHRAGRRQPVRHRATGPAVGRRASPPPEEHPGGTHGTGRGPPSPAEHVTNGRAPQCFAQVMDTLSMSSAFPALGRGFESRRGPPDASSGGAISVRA